MARPAFRRLARSGLQRTGRPAPRAFRRRARSEPQQTERPRLQGFRPPARYGSRLTDLVARTPRTPAAPRLAPVIPGRARTTERSATDRPRTELRVETPVARPLARVILGQARATERQLTARPRTGLRVETRAARLLALETLAPFGNSDRFPRDAVDAAGTRTGRVVDGVL